MAGAVTAVLLSRLNRQKAKIRYSGGEQPHISGSQFKKSGPSGDRDCGGARGHKGPACPRRSTRVPKEVPMKATPCANRYARGVGFTLIELLVVIGIVGLLVALLLTALSRAWAQ